MYTSETHLETNSPEETESLGATLASKLPQGTVLALRGDLAAGKTCLVRGIAQGLGCSGAVSSPTFTLVNEYCGKSKLYHLDLYRLDSAYEIADLGYEELFEPVDGITVVEWAERAEDLLPERRVDVYLEHAGGDRRRIRLVNRHCLADGWEGELRQAVS